MIHLQSIIFRGNTIYPQSIYNSDGVRVTHRGNRATVSGIYLSTWPNQKNIASMVFHDQSRVEHCLLFGFKTDFQLCNSSSRMQKILGSTQSKSYWSMTIATQALRDRKFTMFDMRFRNQELLNRQKVLQELHSR